MKKQRAQAGKTYLSPEQVEAFADWLRHEANGPNELRLLAERAGVGPDTLWKYKLRGRKLIAVDIADRVLTARGAHLHDLERDDEPRRIRPRRVFERPEKPCPCRCGQVGFCDEHRARLEAVKASLDERGKQFGDRSKRPKKRPRCGNKACGAPRPMGEQYCVECRDAGWSEEEAA